MPGIILAPCFQQVQAARVTVPHQPFFPSGTGFIAFLQETPASGHSRKLPRGRGNGDNLLNLAVTRPVSQNVGGKLSVLALMQIKNAVTHQRDFRQKRCQRQTFMRPAFQPDARVDTPFRQHSFPPGAEYRNAVAFQSGIRPFPKLLQL